MTGAPQASDSEGSQASADASSTTGKRALETGDGVVCRMCESLEVKYRCPRCERITCSLACCLAHKKEFECDGKRDRTKFIATKEFTDSDLSSDYFFLEEISRSTSSAARSRNQLGVNAKRFGQSKAQHKKRRVGAPSSLGIGGTVNPHVPSDWLTRFPVAFQTLVQHTAKRGVALTLLAPGMSKRTRNTSYMNTKESKLFWRIEWAFPAAEVAVSLFEERADDGLTPFDLLDKYLERRPENTGLRSKLKMYATPTWRTDLVLLLRKEFAASSQPQYYRLDGNRSLESNLKLKAIVEFPIIHVVPQSDLDQFTIVNDLIEIVATPAQNEDDDELSCEDDDRDTNEDDVEELDDLGSAKKEPDEAVELEDTSL